MWSRIVQLLTVGLAFVLMLGVVGGGIAAASNPGDNGRLVYAETVENEWVERVSEIFTMNPDGTDVRQLTFDAGQEPTVNTGDYWQTDNYSPVWSPKGDMIAYVHHGQTNAYSIRLMDPEGRPLGTVTEDFSVPRTSESASVLSWSPDGERLALLGYTHLVPHDGLWVVNIDGTSPELLISENRSQVRLSPTHFNDPTWSPRGDLVAFGASSPQTRRSFVYVIGPDGSGLRTIECGIDRGWDPDWSPDGDALYCASEGFIFETGMPAGSSAETIGSYEGREAQPTASPDGEQLLFVSDFGGEKGLWSLAPLTRIADFGGDHLDWQPIQGAFWDDEGSVFLSDIERLAAAGITKGCNPPLNDKYCPDAAVTRGQMAAFLVRALGLTDRMAPIPFIDDEDSIFEADIERLAAAGITKGCNPPANDQFCPDSKVTREVMAAFLVRALKYTDDEGGDLFTDDDDSIFEGDIDRLGTAGVTRGCNPPTNDRFCPKGVVTRGQMAAFLHRALG